jgi:ATP diphosphatase
MSTEQQNPASNEELPAHVERARSGDAILGRSLALVRYLRDRCEWDARQTPASLRPYLLEEAHEVADAILARDETDLARELGDLLLNVAFQIVLGEERRAFDAEIVVGALEMKMRDRHPHVYGDAEQAPDWESLKAGERRVPGGDTDTGARDDPFDGLPAGLEPLSRALRMQDRAAGLNFDWPDVRGALEKLEEEVRELGELLGGYTSLEENQRAGHGRVERVEEELGDLLFAAVNVARLLDLHPSTALERAAAKFASRFRSVLEMARRQGIDPREATLEQLDSLWGVVKSEGAAD